ncbi:hypothetical protein PF010_g5770 [Phytophthora fragariae]|uniref:Uncharacterized protein n=1 Tax=Phytophthora fragariae TaxID=53985 RepID=A0A6A3UE01_9STRA|nr:hypothetical protein PF003_g23996 [Phytophthora fragariae]KAE8943124.1 hypothetical protein PF009_g7136 [Phytophthora fragariae]KAE9124551.1 hypothetical protein PF007_g6672 [Phytophthora fragariae]KAE9125077.1 hypothetical protein PF010_g5770 [Phytophthora fragariae]KAE9149708.1 hypothetical protein PF006_g5843 [Phytophthora fragariae]
MQAEPGRARTGSGDGVESTAVVRARGDDNPGNIASATTEGGGEASELLAPLRGVAGQRDKLEEFQTKLEQRLEPPKKDAKALMDTGLFASALGRGARMHIDSLSGTPHTQTPRRPTAPPQYFGLRHADVGSHEPGYGMSELQKLYAAEHAAQAGQGAQQPPAVPACPKLSLQLPPRSTSIYSRTRAGRSDTRTPAKRTWKSARSTARSCTSGWTPASWSGAGGSNGRWHSGSRRAASRGRRT